MLISVFHFVSDIAGAKLRTPLHRFHTTISTSQVLEIASVLESKLISNSLMPRHGGFDLLHPADTRAYMTNVRNVLEQQESFQLWCQLQVARLQYCLELLEQLEDNQTSKPAGSMLNSHFSLELTETFLRTQQVYKLRRTMEETIRILRHYRFAHHHNEQFLRTRQLLHRDFQQALTTGEMVCHELLTRTRSAPAVHRWRSYVRTAMPYDMVMWQRNQLPQFDPASDSE